MTKDTPQPEQVKPQSSEHHDHNPGRKFAWLFVLAGSLAIILFGYWQSFIVNPLLISLLLAYILNPVVMFLERWFSRSACVTMVLLVLIGTMLVGTITVGTFLLGETSNFKVILLGKSEITKNDLQHPFWPMPKPKAQQELIQKQQKGLIETLRLWSLKTAKEYNDKFKLMDDAALEEAFEWDEIRRYVQANTETIKKHSAAVFSNLLSAVKSGISWAIAMLLWLVLVPIFTFFAMLNLNNLKDMLFEHIPYTNRNQTIDILYKIHNSISAFFRGRLLIALILAVICTPLLMACDLKFSHAIILSLTFGAVIVIPYAWILTNLIPTIIILNWTVVDPSWSILFASLVYIALACVEMLILTPAILGKKVQLHPVFLLVSIFLFGSVFGLFGVLMAVPLACIAKILLESYFMPKLKLLAQPPEK